MFFVGSALCLRMKLNDILLISAEENKTLTALQLDYVINEIKV
jgi:hypothetical protein